MKILAALFTGLVFCSSLIAEESILVNGMRPEEAFKTFLADPTHSDVKAEFEKRIPNFSVIIVPDRQMNDKKAGTNYDIRLVLFTDKTFALKLTQNNKVIFKDGGAFWNGEDSVTEFHSGKWSYGLGDINLENVGTLSYLDYNNQAALIFRADDKQKLLKLLPKGILVPNK